MSETRLIAKHAGTILIGQFAVMAFGLTDTLVASRYADTALAILSLGAATFVTVYISLMGMLQALLPIWAELNGARQRHQLGHSLRQSIWLIGSLAVLGMTILYHPQVLFRWTQIPNEFQQEVTAYLQVVAWGLPGALTFRVFSTLNQSLGKPKLVTVIQLLGLAIKIPLSIFLVTGLSGFWEPMGLIGCAWASLVVNYFMSITGLILIRTQDLYQPYQIWRFPERPDWRVLSGFLRLGIPSALSIGVEVTSFTLLALFIARLGVHATASHQIASNLTALLYMVPLSLSIATSARTSFWLGSAQPDQARKTLIAGFQITLTCALCLSFVIAWLNEPIAKFYSHSPEIAALASVLLSWVALYHVADALQVFSVFTLRSYRITMVPLVIYTLCLWGVGLAGGYWLAYRAQVQQIGTFFVTQSPLAFWQTSAIALWIAALTLVSLLMIQLKRSLHSPAV